MKIISKDGRTWFQKNEDGSTSVGFTKDFLSGLECCWHMVAAGRLEIKEDQPMLSVETNDGLFSVNAPVSGVISYFDNKALNFPDKLDDETVVALMKAPKEEANEVDEFANPFAEQPRARLGDILRGVEPVNVDWENARFPIDQVDAVQVRQPVRPRGGF